MLRIDFGQTFLDHRSILVLVKKLGSIKEDEFSQLFEDISQLRMVELPNSRTVHLRYTRHISHQFVDWGSFHTHKKLLGILSIARCPPDKDLASIKSAHEKLKTWYSNTSLDSRCFLLDYGDVDQEETKKDMREFVFLNASNSMKEIERQVADYAMSLFLVLESKRMDKSLEKPDKVILLRSPLDGDAPVDAENRNRKQCIGRMKKYIGDLCLVAGVPQEAIFHYSVAMEFLRSIGDSLWLCGSYEGLCAASLLCRSEQRMASLERRSLQLNVNQLSTAGPVDGVGGDNEEVRISSAIPWTDEEIIEKSDEIFQVYGRHKESKVLGVEARFKYARFFIVKKMYREASNALQDVLSTELALSDAEKIQQYSAMSIMYEDIGFTRKAAFFTRMAALHCTSQHLPLQGWTAGLSTFQSYNLLRNALEGYRIFFDDNHVKEGKGGGWPELQTKLMRELIKMSEELQRPDIPIRHISYLLHTMHRHMQENTIMELTTSLENLVSRDKQSTLVGNLVLGNGDTLPPVTWNDFPVVRKLKVNVLASHLRPFVSPASPIKSPFIFSTLNKKSGKHKKHSPIVNWVEGEVGEVAMQVCNPMPFDIKVSKMTLLTEGVQFQAFPSCLALSNDAMSHPFMLLGIPESPGQLRIKGYSVEVFGIQSNCPLTPTVLDNPLDLPLHVNVVPRLPLVQFHSSTPNIKSSVNSSHRGSSLFLDVMLYTGQTISGLITMENVGKVPVENVTITILSSFKTGHANIVELEQDLKNTLPLQPDSSSQFNLVFNGILGPNDGDNFTWTGKIKVTYSGGAAWEQGMSRQAAIDIKVEIVRGLQCTVLDIVPLESDEQHFEISMDVQNQTTQDFEWKYEVNREATSSNEVPSILPANIKTRACIVLEKLDLSKVDDKRSECDRCTEKLSELVKLRWRIPELEISGMFNLEGFHLNEETINVLRKYSFVFEIEINGLSVRKDEEITTKASTPVMLTVKATNCTDYEVKPTILNIEPFEVDEDGSQVFEVKPKICWLGSTSTLLPKVSVGETAEHTCGFLFLCPGQYYVNVRCFERATTNTTHSFRDRAHVIKSSSPTTVKPRTSRSESFTDSLLLRQRSISTPLAMLAHSAVIRVVDDSDVDAEDAGTCATQGEDLGEIQQVCEETVKNNDGVSNTCVDVDSKNVETLNENSTELAPVEHSLNGEDNEGYCVQDKDFEGEVHSEEPKDIIGAAPCQTKKDINQDEDESLKHCLDDQTDMEAVELEASETTNVIDSQKTDEKDDKVSNETNSSDQETFEKLNEETREQPGEETAPVLHQSTNNEISSLSEDNKELEGTNSSLPEDKELEGTNSSSPEDKELEGTNSSLPEDKELEGTNNSSPEDKELEGTNSSLPEDKELEGTNSSSPEDKELEGTNGELVRSPSVQERIMFFNSN